MYLLLLYQFHDEYHPHHTQIYSLSLHDALPISNHLAGIGVERAQIAVERAVEEKPARGREQARSEEHTSELQSRGHHVCRLLLEKKNLDYSEPIPSALQYFQKLYHIPPTASSIL